VLRIRSFRRLWLVLGLSSLGDWLGLLATVLFAAGQVQGATQKGLAFGGVVIVRLLPALILGPIAGAFADRFDRRLTMVTADLLRFALFASIPLAGLAMSGAGAVTWALIATFAIEVLAMFWIPAKEAAVPNLVKGRLEAANQLSLITTYGLTPVLAALLLAGISRAMLAASGEDAGRLAVAPVEVALYVNALTFLAAASSRGSSARSPRAAW
jgi:dTMP kinase